MFNNGFELFVQVDGHNIPEFGHKGRTYCVGKKNTKYQIRFRNKLAERVFVALTVDGLNVVDGRSHGEEGGYVVQGYSSLSVTGWRTSLQETRAFEFTDKSASYAGKTEGQQNCGVIGAKVFSEAVRNVYWQLTCGPYQPYRSYRQPYQMPTPEYPTYTPPWYTTSTPLRYATSQPIMQCTCQAAPTTGLDGPSDQIAVNMMSGVDPAVVSTSVPSGAPDFNLGTGYGEAIQDAVVQTSFEKGICVAALEIYYSDQEGLIKDGIPVDKAPAVASFPQAFAGFCKLPS